MYGTTRPSSATLRTTLTSLRTIDARFDRGLLHGNGKNSYDESKPSLTFFHHSSTVPPTSRKWNWAFLGSNLRGRPFWAYVLLAYVQTPGRNAGMR